MAVAVSKAVEDGADGVICASTGNTAASAAAYAARADLTAVVLCPAGAIAAGEARAVARRRRAPPRGPRQLRRGARELPRDRRAGHLRARQLAQPAPDRGPEDGRVRDRRAARRAPPTCSRCPTAAAATRSPTRRASTRRRARRGSSRRTRSSARRRWPRRSGSPSRRTSPRSRRSSPTAASSPSPSPTTTSRECGSTSQATRGSSASRPRPPASPALAKIELEPGSTVVCVLTGHGLKDTAAVDLITSVPILVEPTVEAILAEVSVSQLSLQPGASHFRRQTGTGLCPASCAFRVHRRMAPDWPRRLSVAPSFVVRAPRRRPTSGPGSTARVRRSTSGTSSTSRPPRSASRS